jgi:hypothetical protein
LTGFDQVERAQYRVRVSDSFDGKEYALSDDLCICRCNPPPRLIADQNHDCQMLALASVETAEEAAARAVSAREPDRMPMRFFDEQTGGCTKPLTQSERNALEAWHVTPAPVEA